MGCRSPKQAISAFRQMMVEMELKNPVAGDKGSETEKLSRSVNSVRLKNNPVELDIL